MLFFIIAGIVLVLGIKLLDITVAQGSINGLIFYVNLIWINQDTFFPALNREADQNFSNLYYLLRLFIAWLNLDFGIETCFIQGMDTYGKTWLQFVFPVYLWLLAALIIVSCSYSVKATKLFGNNAVTVLGTLFLLSYAKIQRTIVLIIAPAELTKFNPSGTRLAWRLDSNLKYFENPHAFLFLMGFVTWFLLCVPFTVALLFVRPLQKLRCFTRIARQPLIDAYTGPLKAKHQYWVGLTLLTRGVLALTVGAFEGVNDTVAIDLVLISCALLCVIVLKVYKKFFLSLLDLVFLFNLVVLCIAFLSTDELETRVVCTCVSVTLSLLIFVVIVVYHVYLLIPNRYKTKQQQNRDEQQVDDHMTQQSVNVPSTTWITIREELLSSNKTYS